MSSTPTGGARPKTCSTPRSTHQQDSDSVYDSQLSSRSHISSRSQDSSRSQTAYIEDLTVSSSRDVCDCSTYHYGRIELRVYMTDITKATTDAVVSSENRFLKSKAPLAVLISSAAGTQFQENIRKLREDHPNSCYGETYIAKSDGHPHWKFVILPVVPRWAENRIDLCKRNLHTTFTNVFDSADDNRAETISLPVLGTGNRVAPAGEVMEIFCNVLKQFSRRANHLREIHLVSLDPTIKVFAVECCDRMMKSESTANTYFTRRLPSQVVTANHKAIAGKPISVGDNEPVKKEADDSSDICSICLNYVKTYYRQELSCKHAFCVGCIRLWFNNCRSCPVCRNTSV